MTRRLFVLATAAVMSSFGLLLPGYYEFLYYEIAAWALLALSVEILYGQAGMLSFGQSVFLALSGYVFLHLSDNLGIGLLGAAVIATACGLVFAGGLGLLMVRLEGHYFVIATVILALGSFLVASSLTSLTGGDDGLPAGPFADTLIGSVSLPSFLKTPKGMFLVVGISVAGLFALAWRLRVSSLGLLIAGVKHEPFRMRALGYPLEQLKYGVWCLAAAVASVGGVLLVMVNRYASATHFHWTVSGEGVVWSFLGGVDTVWGAWLGTAVLIIGKDFLSTRFGYYPILVGLILILLVHLRSEGLLRLLSRIGGGNRVWSRARCPPRPSRTNVGRSHRSLDEPSEVLFAAKGLAKEFRGTVALDQCCIEVGTSSIEVGLFDGRSCSIDPPSGRYPALALVGPNGAGKTTLLNVLCGYLRPDAGEIRAGALEFRSGAANMGIGRSFQEPRVWNELSVYENLLLGALRSRTWKELGRRVRQDSAAAQTAISLASELGLFEELEKQAATLSFGKRKVLDIGIALASRPRLLMLDEPTAGVSPRELRELESLVSRMKQWAPVLLVEHNLESIRRLGFPVLFMAAGRMLECGLLEDVLSQERVREQFSGLRGADEH